MLTGKRDSVHTPSDLKAKCTKLKKKEYLFTTNTVVTAKYNWILFLPLCLFYLFQKVPNMYYLATTIIYCIPAVSPLSPYSMIAALVFVIGVSTIREAVEDYYRHKEDKRINNTPCYALRGREWTELTWKDVQVGDVMLVCGDETLPADLVVLATSNAGNGCHIQTVSLDGETNYKTRFGLVGDLYDSGSKEEDEEISPSMKGQGSNAGPNSGLKLPVWPAPDTELPVSPPELFVSSLSVHRGALTSDLDKFPGSIKYIDSLGKTVEKPVSNDNFLPRESFLRICAFVVGVVVATGRETKIMLGQRQSGVNKTTKVDGIVMRIVLYIVLLQAVLCLIGGLLAGIMYYRSSDRISANLPMITTTPTVSTSVEFGGLAVLTVLLLITNLLPISMQVSLEMVKLLQTFFINFDEELVYFTSTGSGSERKSQRLNISGQDQAALPAGAQAGSSAGIGAGSGGNGAGFTGAGLAGSSGPLQPPNLNPSDVISSPDMLMPNHHEDLQVNRTSPRVSVLHLRQKSPTVSAFSGPSRLGSSSAQAVVSSPVDSSMGQSINQQDSLGARDSMGGISRSASMAMSGTLRLDPPGELLRAKARTTTLNEDLGQIGYLFSDKTGTLTSNDMVFKCLSVGGVSLDTDDSLEAAGASVADFLNIGTSSSPGSPSAGSLANTLAQGPGNMLDSGSQAVLKASLLMAGCNDVNVSVLDKTQYVGESPDEVCLAAAAKDQLQIGLVKRDKTKICLQIGNSYSGNVGPVGAGLGSTGHSDSSWMLQVKLSFAFSNDRKRSSSVFASSLSSSGAQTSSSGAQASSFKTGKAGILAERSLNLLDGSKCLLLMKGADDIMLSLCSPNDPLKSFCIAEVDRFSRKGFRCLVAASKLIEKSQVDAAAEKIRKIQMDESTDSDAKSAAISKIAAELEAGCELLGVLALEDKLQEFVPECISALRRGGIAVWMITGDKLTTAFEIAKSCALFPPGAILKQGGSNKNATQANLGMGVLGAVGAPTAPAVGADLVVGSDPGDSPTPSRVANMVIQIPVVESESVEELSFQLNSLLNKTDYLVVTGKSLGSIKSSESLTKIFAKVGVQCKSVVCCRSTKDQKAFVVGSMMAEVKSTGVLCVAVGDGANDVAMIKKAHIGVGIYGKEGRQAAQNSDYAIARFHHLERLILHHGRANYYRICKVILYFLFKNAAFTVPQYIYLFVNNWSGATYYIDYYITTFNLIFTALPVFMIGTLDIDVRPVSVGKGRLPSSYHKLYYVGQQNKMFDWKVFCTMAVLSLVAGILSAAPLLLDFSGASWVPTIGMTPGLWPMSITTYTCIIVISNVGVLAYVESINFPLIVFQVLSMMYYVSWVWSYSYYPGTTSYGSSYFMSYNIEGYLFVLLYSVSTVLVLLAMFAFRQRFSPSLRTRIRLQTMATLNNLNDAANKATHSSVTHLMQSHRHKEAIAAEFRKSQPVVDTGVKLAYALDNTSGGLKRPSPNV